MPRRLHEKRATWFAEQGDWTVALFLDDYVREQFGGAPPVVMSLSLTDGAVENVSSIAEARDYLATDRSDLEQLWLHWRSRPLRAGESGMSVHEEAGGWTVRLFVTSDAEEWATGVVETAKARVVRQLGVKAEPEPFATSFLQPDREGSHTQELIDATANLTSHKYTASARLRLGWPSWGRLAAYEAFLLTHVRQADGMHRVSVEARFHGGVEVGASVDEAHARFQEAAPDASLVGASIEGDRYNPPVFSARLSMRRWPFRNRVVFSGADEVQVLGVREVFRRWQSRQRRAERTAHPWWRPNPAEIANAIYANLVWIVGVAVALFIVGTAVSAVTRLWP